MGAALCAACIPGRGGNVVTSLPARDGAFSGHASRLGALRYAAFREALTAAAHVRYYAAKPNSERSGEPGAQARLRGP